MSKQPTRVIAEAERVVTTVLSSTHPKTKEELQEVRRAESRREVMQSLVTLPADQLARVNMSVSTKVSDAAHYGPGTWDKIPYGVEVHCSVSLPCDPTEEAIQTAQNVAQELAWEASRACIGDALIGHDDDIRTRLYRAYFEKE